MTPAASQMPFLAVVGAFCAAFALALSIGEVANHFLMDQWSRELGSAGESLRQSLLKDVPLATAIATAGFALGAGLTWLRAVHGSRQGLWMAAASGVLPVMAAQVINYFEGAQGAAGEVAILVLFFGALPIAFLGFASMRRRHRARSS